MLKSSPLFYLFISSKELFHTNFWLWLSTLNAGETLKLFTENFSQGEFDFKREHRIRAADNKATVDLFVCSKDGSSKIVIENKVKDFPSIEQLDRIRNAFGEEHAEFIITTLFWNSGISFNGWTIRTYKKIANAIKPDNFTDNGYYRNLIADYKSFILGLDALVSELPITERYDFALSFQPELFNLLNEVKLAEGYQKLRSSHLMLKFKSFNKHNASLGYGINNKMATIEFVLNLRKGYKIGIQIENGQYRKFVSGENAEAFANNILKNGLYFSDFFEGKSKKRFLKYSNNFRYQYDILKEIGFDDLFALINKDLEYVKNNFDRIERLIPI